MKKQTAFRLSKDTLNKLSFLQEKQGKNRTWLVENAVALYYRVYLADTLRNNTNNEASYTPVQSKPMPGVVSNA